jgi:hypothetical protein
VRAPQGKRLPSCPPVSRADKVASVQQTLDHPERLYPIILILVFLLIVLYLRKLGERKGDLGPSAYLGTSLHAASMAEAIEDVSRRILTTYPTLDDAEQARMVRDDLRLRGLKNVDMYEGAIFATITRLKGGAARTS